jgi:transposase
MSFGGSGVRKNFVYATVFSDPEAGVVIDLAPGRDASAVMFFAHLYSQSERARVRVVTIDCHAPYRMAVRALFPNALIVADAFHLHRRVGYALTEVRREAWNTWRQRSPRLGRVFKSVRFALMRPRDELEADTSRRGERQRMLIFDATNLDHRLGVAYELKEAFRAAMAIGKRGDEENFAVAIDLFVT